MALWPALVRLLWRRCAVAGSETLGKLDSIAKQATGRR